MSSREIRINGLLKGADWKSLGITLALVPFLSIASWWIIAYFVSPLRNYPGPRLAGKLRKRDTNDDESES
jgi:hypothetical protein